jgi:hypothetical protein
MLEEIFKRFLLSLICLFLISGCIEIEQTIKLNRDGSGHTKIKLVLDKSLATEALREIKRETKRNPQWVITEKTFDKDTGQVKIIMERDFTRISELNEKGWTYYLKPVTNEMFREEYIAGVKVTDRNLVFPVTISMEVPGKILDANGLVISKNVVRWDVFRPSPRPYEVRFSFYTNTFYFLVFAGIAIFIVLIGIGLVVITGSEKSGDKMIEEYINWISRPPKRNI